MIDEAKVAGLRFRQRAIDQLILLQNQSAPLHDSRKGLAGYYRYQPRKIAARLNLNPRDRTSLIMQDPRGSAWPLLTSVQVHESVLDRIRSGPDRYPPVVLPKNYTVVQRNGTVIARPESKLDANTRVQGQEIVWNDVWRKRVGYYASLGASLALATIPCWGSSTACEGPQCLLSPIIRAIGAVLPSFASHWIEAFARNPGKSLLLAGLLAWLLLWNASLQRRIRDRMHALWKPMHGQHCVPVPGPRRSDLLIRRLRTSCAYQKTIQMLKWKVVPALFGWALLIVLTACVAVPSAVAIYRWQLVSAERSGKICHVREGATAQVMPAGQQLFSTKALCWDTGRDGDLEEGKSYQMRMIIAEPWHHAAIPASPEGFESGMVPPTVRCLKRQQRAGPFSGSMMRS